MKRTRRTSRYDAKRSRRVPVPAAFPQVDPKHRTVKEECRYLLRNRRVPAFPERVPDLGTRRYSRVPRSVGPGTGTASTRTPCFLLTVIKQQNGIAVNDRISGTGTELMRRYTTTLDMTCSRVAANIGQLRAVLNAMSASKPVSGLDIWCGSAPLFFDLPDTVITVQDVIAPMEKCAARARKGFPHLEDDGLVAFWVDKMRVAIVTWPEDDDEDDRDDDEMGLDFAPVGFLESDEVVRVQHHNVPCGWLLVGWS
jgi:hypothetical protein